MCLRVSMYVYACLCVATCVCVYLCASPVLEQNIGSAVGVEAVS